MASAYIDLGHGGHDSGAVGHGGVLEKKIVYDVGLMVKDLLVQNNVKVKLSRNSDVFVSLYDRVYDSHKFNANCFVSIHCNSASNKTARGYETFCYKKTDKLGQCVHNSIIKNKSLYEKNRGLKEANYYVIKNTMMQACLCELGFISNELDKNLVLKYKKEFAICIARGICEYLGVAFKESSTSVENSKEYSIGEYKRKVCVTVDALNVRNGRGVEYEKVGQLKKDNKVEIWYIDKAKDGSLWGSFRFVHGGKNEVGFIAMKHTMPV